ncbi:acyl-CoA N-acyltransferase [Haematococcus lacustris]
MKAGGPKTAGERPSQSTLAIGNAGVPGQAVKRRRGSPQPSSAAATSTPGAAEGNRAAHPAQPQHAAEQRASYSLLGSGDVARLHAIKQEGDSPRALDTQHLPGAGAGLEAGLGGGAAYQAAPGGGVPGLTAAAGGAHGGGKGAKGLLVAQGGLSGLTPVAIGGARGVTRPGPGVTPHAVVMGGLQAGAPPAAAVVSTPTLMAGNRAPGAAAPHPPSPMPPQGHSQLGFGVGGSLSAGSNPGGFLTLPQGPQPPYGVGHGQYGQQTFGMQAHGVVKEEGGGGGQQGQGPPAPSSTARFLAMPPKEGYMRPDVVKLPLEVNTRVACKQRDGKHHMARIIERRLRSGPGPGGSGAPEECDYYVHYIKFNRRMDEWVVQSQLDLATVEVEIPELDPKKKKRMLADDPDSDSDHGDFDVNALREHEEFTKLMLQPIEEPSHRPAPPTPHRVDGKREKSWCQALCMLAKLFLDHKTLYFDVDLFLFYILCELDERGAHMVGYFSKEKQSEEGYNLACILTLPSFQRKGYGKALISLSYELSKLEGKVGTPERPLSDLGRVSYHGYWTRELLAVLQSHEGSISIKELSERTAMKPDDIEATLRQLGLIQMQKGQHVIVAAPHIVKQHLKQAGGPGLVIEPSKIVWTPYNAEREYVQKGH